MASQVKTGWTLSGSFHQGNFDLHDGGVACYNDTIISIRKHLLRVLSNLNTYWILKCSVKSLDDELFELVDMARKPTEQLASARL